MRYAVLIMVTALSCTAPLHAQNKSVPSLAKHNSPKKAMSKQYDQIITQLSLFKKEHDVKALSQAISLAAAMPDDAAPVAPANTQDKLAAWLAIFDILDSELAADFNPAEVPQMTVAPPPESGLPAGVAPDSIKDPAMRKKYKEALSSNGIKNQRYRYQYALLQEAERAEAEVEDYITSVWLAEPALSTSLQRRLDAAKLLPQRRAKLLQPLATGK